MGAADGIVGLTFGRGGRRWECEPYRGRDSDGKFHKGMNERLISKDRARFVKGVKRGSRAGDQTRYSEISPPSLRFSDLHHPTSDVAARCLLLVKHVSVRQCGRWRSTRMG